MNNKKLEIKNLHVSVENETIVKGVNLQVKKGEKIAIMGPNGSGKSTLVKAVMGHPDYKIEKGKILYDDEDVTQMETDERAQKGLFLSFQYPSEVSGVTISNFLRTARQEITGEEIEPMEFMKELKQNLKKLDMDETFAERYLNEDFSGGEKKRSEILQLATLKPDIALLDETDSGLDIDALKIVADGINELVKEGMGTLLVTHYQRILEYIKPDKVYILIDGKVAKKGNKELAEQVEEKGYDWLR